MKIHQEMKKATLVHTFSIGIFFLSKIDQLINRNCVLSNTIHIPAVSTLCCIVYMHCPRDSTAINIVCAQMHTTLRQTWGQLL